MLPMSIPNKLNICTITQFFTILTVSTNYLARLNSATTQQRLTSNRTIQQTYRYLPFTWPPSQKRTIFTVTQSLTLANFFNNIPGQFSFCNNIAGVEVCEKFNTPPCRGACTTGAAGGECPLPFVYGAARGRRNALFLPLFKTVLNTCLSVRTALHSPSLI